MTRGAQHFLYIYFEHIPRTRVHYTRVRGRAPACRLVTVEFRRTHAAALPKRSWYDCCCIIVRTTKLYGTLLLYTAIVRNMVAFSIGRRIVAGRSFFFIIIFFLYIVIIIFLCSAVREKMASARPNGFSRTPIRVRTYDASPAERTRMRAYTCACSL